MIKVGYGVTLLSRCLAQGGIDGIGSYSKELHHQLAALSNIDLSLISFGQEIPAELKTSSAASVWSKFGWQASLSATTHLNFFDSYRKDLKDLDIFHATDHRIPKLRKTPVVATVMDAIPLSNPEWVNMRFANVKFAVWKKSVKWAEQVITISEYSKQQIIEFFGVDENKISVIPLGVDKRWFRKISEYQTNQIKSVYNLPEKFFLSVGTIQPRKNIERVVEAHQQLPKNLRDSVPLVIVGRHGWMCEDLIDDIQKGKYQHSIIWLKHLPDDDLVTIMKLASALVFVSLSEGFGLPVLEAFASMTPVVTSNLTSLPEVAQNAALLVDPYDTEQVSDAMTKIIDNPQLVDGLVQRGYHRAKEFTWNQTARETLKLYESVIG